MFYLVSRDGGRGWTCVAGHYTFFLRIQSITESVFPPKLQQVKLNFCMNCDILLVLPTCLPEAVIPCIMLNQLYVFLSFFCKFGSRSDKLKKLKTKTMTDLMVGGGGGGGVFICSYVPCRHK